MTPNNQTERQHNPPTRIQKRGKPLKGAKPETINKKQEAVMPEKRNKKQENGHTRSEKRKENQQNTKPETGKQETRKLSCKKRETRNENQQKTENRLNGDPACSGTSRTSTGQGAL